MAEDPRHMHRVKKVAFHTRLQSGMSLRVSNHSFFNSYLNLNRQCHAPKLMNVNQECRPLFGHGFLPLTQTRRLVIVGTLEIRFLYQRHLLVHLVHQRYASCTNGVPQYIRCIQRPPHVHSLPYGTIRDRSSRYEKLCAPKTAFV